MLTGLSRGFCAPAPPGGGCCPPAAPCARAGDAARTNPMQAVASASPHAPGIALIAGLLQELVKWRLPAACEPEVATMNRVRAVVRQAFLRMAPRLEPGVPPGSY